MAKILIIDDSEAIRIQLRKDLESKGHSVVEAVDGMDGLNQLQKATDTELIICDVNMPKMDGLTMIAKVNQQPQYSSIKIFMLTTEGSADMKTRGKEIGVKAWITKPYLAEKLLSAVEKICQK